MDETQITIPEAEQSLVEFRWQTVFVWLDQLSDRIKVLLQLESSLHTEEEHKTTAIRDLTEEYIIVFTVINYISCSGLMDTE